MDGALRTVRSRRMAILQSVSQSVSHSLTHSLTHSVNPPRHLPLPQSHLQNYARRTYAHPPHPSAHVRCPHPRPQPALRSYTAPAVSWHLHLHLHISPLLLLPSPAQPSPVQPSPVQSRPRVRTALPPNASSQTPTSRIVSHRCPSQTPHLPRLTTHTTVHTQSPAQPSPAQPQLFPQSFPTNIERRKYVPTRATAPQALLYSHSLSLSLSLHPLMSVCLPGAVYAIPFIPRQPSGYYPAS